MFLNLNENMKLVFELKKENEKETERVETIRSLTLNLDSPIGLKGEYGLYDSQEWWENIHKGILKAKTITGVITRVYRAGQENSGEINSIDLILNDGNKISSGIYVNDIDDTHLFLVGKKVSIYYIFEKLKSGDLIDLVVEMAVSDRKRRSDCTPLMPIS